MSAAPAMSASGMSADRSASFAPRSVRKLRSPSGSMSATSRPVSWSLSSTRCGLTPAALSRAVSLSRSAAPTRATKSTSAPNEASHAAWLAAEPPGLKTIDARRSEPRASGPVARTTMSVITSPMTRMRSLLVTGCAALLRSRRRQRLYDGDIGHQALWQAVPLSEVVAAVVGDPHLALRILRDQDLERQVDGRAWSGQHQRRAGLRIAEDQELGRRHGHPRLCSFTAVVHEREQGDALRLQDRLELVDRLVNGMTGRNFDDSFFFPHGPCPRWRPQDSRASSTAACAASMALFLISAILASRLLPSVSSTTRLSRNGVASFLPTPCARASITASAIRSSIVARSSA